MKGNRSVIISHAHSRYHVCGNKELRILAKRQCIVIESLPLDQNRLTNMVINCENET